MRRKIIPILIKLVFASCLYAQDQSHFNLYDQFSPAINPASLGRYDRLNATLLFNYQMIDYKGAPIQFFADVLSPIGTTDLILGGNIQHDRIGGRTKTNFTFSAAYRVTLQANHYLNFGISTIFRLTETHFQNLVQQDIGDPLIASQTQQYFTPDFRFGIQYFTNNYFVGINVGNIITSRHISGSTNIQSRPEDIHFYLHTGYCWNFKPEWKFQPSLLWKQIAGSPTQIDINANFLYKDKFGFGISYRTLNSIVFRANFVIKKTFKIGYAFGMGTGFANNLENYGHELILIYQVNKSKKILPIKFINQ